MNNLFIALLIGILIIGGGGYWYMQKESGVTFTNDEVSRTRNFASVLQSGENVRCTVEHTQAGSTVKGTVYMADRGERIRGEFSVTGTIATDINMVRDEGYTYLWGGGFSQGMKMAVTEENKNQLFSSDDASIPDDVDFSCEAWSVDESVFALPVGMAFVDTGSIMQNLQGMQGNVDIKAGASGSVDMKAMQCAACDQAGSAREQCRQALGCE